MEEVEEELADLRRQMKELGMTIFIPDETEVSDGAKSKD
jgi:hypothetical protein